MIIRRCAECPRKGPRRSWRPHGDRNPAESGSHGQLWAAMGRAVNMGSDISQSRARIFVHGPAGGGERTRGPLPGSLCPAGGTPPHGQSARAGSDNPGASGGGARPTGFSARRRAVDARRWRRTAGHRGAQRDSAGQPGTVWYRPEITSRDFIKRCGKLAWTSVPTAFTGAAAPQRLANRAKKAYNCTDCRRAVVNRSAKAKGRQPCPNARQPA